MGQIENYRPELINGKLTVTSGHILFESDSPAKQIILPLELIEFINQCNGRQTLSEIIHKLYQIRGYVKIKQILYTLNLLKENGFLKNPEGFKINKKESGNYLPQFQYKLSFPIIRRIFNDKKHPVVFYFIAMGLTISALFALFQIKAFQNISEINYSSSFFGFFIAGSLILSFKSIIKLSLQMLLTGRSYNLSLNLTPFGLHTDVSNQSLKLVNNPLYLSIYHFITFMSPVVALGLVELLDLHFLKDIFYISALFIMLFDTNPFNDKSLLNGFVSYIFPKYYNRNCIVDSSSIAEYFMHSYKKEKWALSSLASGHYLILWSVLLGYFASLYIPAALKSQPLDISGWVNSLLLTAVIGTFVLHAFYCQIRICQHFFKGSVNNKNSSQPGLDTLYDYNHSHLQSLLEQLPVFADLPTELLSLIIQKSKLQNVKKGIRIIEEGQDANYIYVLITGKMDVYKNIHGEQKHISILHPICLFGELAVVESRKRGASVICSHDAIVLQISSDVLMKCFAEASYQNELAAFKNSILINQFFNSAPKFKELHPVIIQTLLQKSNVEDYKNDEVIFDQGSYGDNFYLVLRGRCKVIVNDTPAGTIEQFGFFGEVSLIADIPRTATVIADQDVTLLKLDKDTFWRLLSKDIEMALYLEEITEARIQYDIEALRGPTVDVA